MLASNELQFSCTSTAVGDGSVTNQDVNYDPFLVDEFEPSDPDNPKNWSNMKRWYLTLLSASGIFPYLREEFHMSEKVGTLTLSLFVCGYCVGPILWGPLSEQYGRRPLFVYPFFVYACFMAGGALAKNTASVLIFRFLGGTFAAAPLTNSGALISDIWGAETRGKALAVFTVAPFAGPALGPIAAGFIGDNISWRWLFWVLTMFAAACELLIILTIPETYAPILLVRKARAKRDATGDHRYYATLERQEKSLRKRIEHVLARPFAILFQEPMLIAMTLYMSFVYGCLYLLFTAYPIVFRQGHNFNAGISGLMFLPIPIGGAVAVALYVYYYNPKYERESAKVFPRAVAPEFRLEMVLYAGPCFAASFFWFGWTSFSYLSYWGPMLSGLLMGFSIQLIFLGLFNYLIDAYIAVAASALASSTVIRSMFGAGFPLFASDMYDALDPRWASTLLGFIAILMIPIPFVLKRYANANELVDAMPPMTFHGVVTKAGFMNKTATVTVSRWVVHKLTGKRIERSKKYLIHDEKNQLRKDDLVVIRNCPPISAMKRFTLHTLLRSPETERDIARALKAKETAQEAGQLKQGRVLEALKQSS
ncbi:polyamine transporter 1 [Agrocybe pediades]|nr:polyamine transporter 1 [Agrocybe pediades]